MQLSGRLRLEALQSDSSQASNYPVLCTVSRLSHRGVGICEGRRKRGLHGMLTGFGLDYRGHGKESCGK